MQEKKWLASIATAMKNPLNECPIKNSKPPRDPDLDPVTVNTFD